MIGLTKILKSKPALVRFNLEFVVFKFIVGAAENSKTKSAGAGDMQDEICISAVLIKTGLH